MPIHIHRHADVGMTQTIAHGLRVSAQLDEHRSLGVSQIVSAVFLGWTSSAECWQQNPFPKRIAIQRALIVAERAEHEVVTSQVTTELVSTSRENLGELGSDRRRHRDDPRGIALRGARNELTEDRLHCLGDREPALQHIDPTDP